jgi:class 3 adenylate cyclase/tetratricopeptide (TPR) repeat protein
MSEREQLVQSIAALEAQRAILGDVAVDTAVAALRKQLAALKAPPTQQRKQATVLFADVSGFTAMSESLDAEQVSDTMSALWQRIDAAIVAQGGTIDKHIGDAVMALWGVDKAREDDPERAIRAALAMQAELAAFREERDAKLAMRVGINTGPVLLGEVRPGEFTAMGDAVNLASRMEHAAPVGGILITHDTYRHARGVFDLLPQEPLKVKGKAEPVQSYVVLRAKSRAFRMATRGVEGIETRMIGRNAELLALQDACQDVIAPLTGEPETRVVTIVGEAGVGKSRLLYEFEQWIELQPDAVYYFRGRASSAMQMIPYGIVRDMFAYHFEILESDSAVTVLKKFRAGMEGILDADQADLIGHLVGFDFSASQAVQNLLNSPSFGQLARAYLSNYLRALANQRPLLVFLDDIHWADDSSLDLVDYLVTAIPAASLMVVCLARPPLFERRPHWGEGRAAHTRLDLKPLSTRASWALVGEILQKMEYIPVALRGLIVEGAEGNPYYVEELIKMLIENGVIQRGEERWRVELDRLAEVRVPPTLTGVLQARLDSLPPGEKTFLQHASVVGRLFWDAAVAELAGDEKAANVDELLEAVGSRELVFRQERSAFAGTDEYIFKHNILRDVTYETVLLKLRRVYHKQVAQWLEHIAGERIGECLSLIAGHYELAGETAKAADYLRRSGEGALQVSAFRDAVRAFERALALLPDAGHARAPLIIQAGCALSRLGDYAQARQCLEEGLALARQHDDGVSRAAALAYLGWITLSQGDYAEARAQLEESLALARQVDDQGRIAHALVGLGYVNCSLGACAEARDCFDESLTFYQALGDRRGIVFALNGLGSVALMLAEYKEAQACYTESLALCRELGERLGVAVALAALGETARKQEDYATAQYRYQEALSISKEIGHRLGVAITFNNLGHMAVAQGDHAAAASYYHEAIQIAMDIGVVPVALDCLAGLAGVLAARPGQAERALELLGLALHHQALDSDAKLTIEPILADLRAKLPPDVVEAALERGQSLELEAVAAEILREATA